MDFPWYCELQTCWNQHILKSYFCSLIPEWYVQPKTLHNLTKIMIMAATVILRTYDSNALLTQLLTSNPSMWSDCQQHLTVLLENQKHRCHTFKLTKTQTSHFQINQPTNVTLSSLSSSIPKKQGSLEHHRWFQNQFHPFFSVLNCPLAIGKLQACHSLMLSSYLFFSIPCFLPLSLCLARWFWSDLMNGRHANITAVCISLRWSGGLCVVSLPAGPWHELLHWKHGLRMRCVVPCGSTSLPWLVSCFGALLWGSMIHKMQEDGCDKGVH